MADQMREPSQLGALVHFRIDKFVLGGGQGGVLIGAPVLA